MPFINFPAREINCKLVYYGPGLGGKTANLQWIYDHTGQNQKGKMVSLATGWKRKQWKLLSLGDLDPQKTLQGILSRFAFKSKSLSKSASNVYPPFFSSASTSLATSFSVSNTPNP